MIPIILISSLDFASNNEFIENPIDQDSTNQFIKDSFLIYKGDTINRWNEKGYRVGLWYKFPDSTSEFTFQYYRTGETGEFSDNLWTKSYFPNGMLRSHWTRDTMKNYFENGNLKSRHFVSRDLFSLVEINVDEYFYASGKMKRICHSSRKSEYSDGVMVSNVVPTTDSCFCWTEYGEKQENCP